jgi:hypothetical protein
MDKRKHMEKNEEGVIFFIASTLSEMGGRNILGTKW